MDVDVYVDVYVSVSVAVSVDVAVAVCVRPCAPLCSYVWLCAHLSFLCVYIDVGVAVYV